MYPKLQTFFVLGLSRSGNAAAHFLLSQNAQVYIYDDVQSEIVDKNTQTLIAQGARAVKKEEVPSMAEICDVLVLSPGIPIDHPVAISFRRNKKAVVGESELAARFVHAPIVAVTGTNGKTTTVSMIASALMEGGMRTFACGNIGAPMIDLAKESAPFFVVAEISSFQLETLNSFCPHIAVVLNVTEDHLNRHYNMENYLFLKAKLLKNLTEAEYAVLNYDDPLVRGFREKTKARIVYFSVREKVDGAYYEDGALYFRGEKIIDADRLLTGGMHNVQNALATVAVAKLMGMDTRSVAKALESFKGVKHRVQPVGVVNGVTYVDDSKGTNVDATVQAVKCMKEDAVLLLGGKDKGYSYDGLFASIKGSKVYHTVLYGENRFRLIDSAEKNGWTNVTLCTGFECAVQIARMIAKEGQTVLLSPASASFDEFADYEERGERFVSIVESFKKKNNGPTEEIVADERVDTERDSSTGKSYDCGECADGLGQNDCRETELE